MRLTTFLILFMVFPAFAGDPHHEHPVEPTPISVPDDGSNHNALAIGAVILLGVCLYHRCWEQTDGKTADAQPSRITPEPTTNEYLRIRKQ